MDDELEWRQPRRHRLYPDSVRGRAWDAACEMARWRLVPRRRRFRLAFERPDQHLLPGNPVEREPSRVAPFQLDRIPLAPRPIPHDLRRGEAFPDRVENIEHHAVEL